MERWGVCDKGLVVRRCHGPSVLLIGPICLWQADLRPGMGLKYDTDLLHLQSTASECGDEMVCFSQAGSWALRLSALWPRLFQDHGPIESYC